MSSRLAYINAIDIAFRCYETKCKVCGPRHVEWYELFKQKGFELLHTSTNGIRLTVPDKYKSDTDDDDSDSSESDYDLESKICTGPLEIQTYVFKTSEFGRLMSHCNTLHNSIEVSDNKIARKCMITAVLTVGKCIDTFHKLIKSMNVYKDNECVKLTKLLLTSEDTIRQLRLELKSFRSTQKRQRKKLELPPPVYIEPAHPDVSEPHPLPPAF